MNKIVPFATSSSVNDSSMKRSESQDDAEQQKREQIPTIDDVPTLYRPLKNLLMIKPMPDIVKIGNIIIPNGTRIEMNEGHVLALGPECTAGIEIGDCVTWDGNTENSMEIDGVKFLLVAQVCCVMSIPKAELEKAAAARLAEETTQ